MVNTEHTYTLTALSDIWTGSVRVEEGNGHLRERIVADRLITTGLLGSIRWWFEVVVRGLGGSACDPTLDGNRCPDSRKGPREPGHHCVVCELFGCTHWARKFRFDVLGDDDGTQQQQIKAGRRFQLRFTPLRPIRDEEWTLLDLTIRLIAEYGAIGGKTVFKPSDESSRANAAHHRDYGLIGIAPCPGVTKSEKELRDYVAASRWQKPSQNDFAWASLDRFWCVNGRYLTRQKSDQSTFNRVIGRPEPKGQAGGNDSWLAGRRAGRGGGPESKKVFSFKGPESARRTFGFVQSTDKLGEMRQRLKEKAWDDLTKDEFVTGGEILRRLLCEGGSR